MRVKAPIRWPANHSAVLHAIRRPAHSTMWWLYSVMGNYAQAEGALTVGMIAKGTGLSIQTTTVWLKVLCAFGLVRQVSKVGQSYVFAMVDDEPGPDTLRLLRGLSQGKVRINVKHGLVFDAEGARVDLGRVREASDVSEVASDVSEVRSAPASDVSEVASDVSEASGGGQHELMLVTATTSAQLAVPGGPDPLIPRMLVLENLKPHKEHTSNQKPDEKRGGSRKDAGRKAAVFDPIAEPVVWEAWSYWRDQLYPHRDVPTTEDASRIRSRLREGATLDELKLIVDYAKSHVWLSGRDPKSTGRYDTLAVLINTRDKFINYRDRANQWKRGPQRDARGIDLQFRESETNEYTAERS